MHKRLLATIICIFVVFSSACGGAGASTKETPQDNAAQAENTSGSSGSANEKASTEETVDEMISKTDDNIAVYIANLGVEPEKALSEASKEFVDGMSSVYLMGKTGTVSHGLTEAATKIDIMNWDSNETDLTHDDFLTFVKLLNKYFKSEAELRSFENVSEETYLWYNRPNLCYVLSSFKDGMITVSWRYDPNIFGGSNSEDSKLSSSDSQPENESKTQNDNTDLPTSETKKTKTQFTNGYGTPTTKCAHPGCNEYIAPSGNTNCCVKHSNRCLDCGRYCDEDAMYCIDCLEKAISELE